MNIVPNSIGPDKIPIRFRSRSESRLFVIFYTISSTRIMLRDISSAEFSVTSDFSKRSDLLQTEGICSPGVK